jgi:hypothetical protein
MDTKHSQLAVAADVTSAANVLMSFTPSAAVSTLDADADLLPSGNDSPATASAAAAAPAAAAVEASGYVTDPETRAAIDAAKVPSKSTKSGNRGRTRRRYTESERRNGVTKTRKASRASTRKKTKKKKAKTSKRKDETESDSESSSDDEKSSKAEKRRPDPIVVEDEDEEEEKEDAKQEEEEEEAEAETEATKEKEEEEPEPRKKARTRSSDVSVSPVAAAAAAATSPASLPPPPPPPPRAPRQKQTAASERLFDATRVGRIPSVPFENGIKWRSTEYSSSNRYDVEDGTTFRINQSDVKSTTKLADVLKNVQRVATDLLGLSHTALHSLYSGSANRFGRCPAELTHNLQAAMHTCLEDLVSCQSDLLGVKFPEARQVACAVSGCSVYTDCTKMFKTENGDYVCGRHNPNHKHCLVTPPNSPVDEATRAAEFADMVMSFSAGSSSSSSSSSSSVATTPV